MKIKKLARDLVSLDKKFQEIDRLTQEVRVAINEIFWDLGSSTKKKKT